MPRPGRNHPPSLDRRWREHRPRGRARGALAVPGDDPAPRAECLHPRHLLLEDRARERVEDEVGATEPQAGTATMGVGDERMPRRIEPRQVIAVSAQGGKLRQRPGRTGPPCGAPHNAGARLADRQGRDARRGATGAPDHGPIDGHGRVARAAPLVQDGATQIERVGRPVLGLERSVVHAGGVAGAVVRSAEPRHPCRSARLAVPSRRGRNPGERGGHALTLRRAPTSSGLCDRPRPAAGNLRSSSHLRVDCVDSPSAGRISSAGRMSGCLRTGRAKACRGRSG